MDEKERPKILRKLEDAGAAVINFHDYVQMRFDCRRLLMRYRVAQFAHKQREKAENAKLQILGYVAGILLVAIALVAVYNYATAFQYAYNGRVLGYVKNQEDVLKILDIVSDELSKEYDTNIDMEREGNFSFKRVVALDKEVDNADTVLKRLTYMSDIQAKGTGIYIENKLFTIVESKEAAETVLNKIKEQYIKETDNTKYEKISFAEKVELKVIDTRLAGISGIASAIKQIQSGGQKEQIYKVKAGDTYSEICADLDTTFEELKKNNPKLSINKLMPGQKIVVNHAVSILSVKTVEKSKYAEKVKCNIKYKKSDSMYEGDQKIEQKGSDGKRVVTAKITRINGKKVKTQILASEMIKKTVTRVVIKGTKKVPKTAPTGKFILPVSSGYTLTSYFGYRWGRMHEGIDLAAPVGTPLRAADGGTVTYAGWFSGYGKYIEITHGNGVTTRYGHCNSISVSKGDKVYKGQQIGTVGNTGNSTGAHCHFEIRIKGSPVNPLDRV